MTSASALLGAGLFCALAATAVAGETARGKSVYDFTMKTIEGKELPLSAYRGKVLLVVNVASECGHTPQYKDLEALYRKYRDRGLVVLGFPANNFGGQEPGTDAEIMEFCSTTYDVTFPMFSKISVAGADQHPLYRFITSPEENPAVAGEVKWNFQKYLVGRDGRVIAKYLSRVKPMSEELTGAVEKALAAPAK